MKIVLIYNDEALQSEQFQRYQEKVIDRELPFSPDVTAILQLVFQNVSRVAADSTLMEDLARRCGALDLRNIRLVAKTRNYYQEVARVLPDMDARFHQSVLTAILLFVWVKFARSPTQDLTFDFLEDYSELSMIMRAEKRLSEEKPTREERATELLQSYGYRFTDDLDAILMRFVKTDVLDETQLRAEHEKYKLSVSKGLLEKRFSEAWQKLFHGTLKDNEAEFCAELVAGARSYMEYIPINQLDAALRMLSQLGRNAEADALLGEFLRTRGEELKRFRRDQMVEAIRFEGLDRKLQDVEREAAIDRRPIGETIEEALKDELIRSSDRKRLAEFSKEDFTQYFITTDMEHLTSTIRRLANQARQFSNSDDIDRKIQNTVRAAVQDIASSSRINRIRMEAMGLVERTEQQG